MDGETEANDQETTELGGEFAGAEVRDVPLDDPIVPDHTASKKRRNLFALTGSDGKANSAKSKKKPPARPRKGSLIEPLASLYTTVGALMTPIDPVCGNAFIVHAESCAKTLDDLAQHNEAVRKALLALTQTSVWGTVLAAHAPILLTIAVHHVPAVRGSMGEMGKQIEQTLQEQYAANNGDKR